MWAVVLAASWVQVAHFCPETSTLKRAELTRKSQARIRNAYIGLRSPVPIIIDVLGSLSDFQKRILRDDGRDPPGADVVCRDTFKDSSFTAVHPAFKEPRRT